MILFPNNDLKKNPGHFQGEGKDQEKNQEGERKAHMKERKAEGNGIDRVRERKFSTSEETYR